MIYLVALANGRSPVRAQTRFGMAFTYLAIIFLVLNFAQIAISQTASVNQTMSEASKLYAGKTPDYWVSEVLRLALTIRVTEENYEKNLRECVTRGNSLKDNAPACVRAKDSQFAAQSARNQYQRLLNAAANTAIPEEWLRAHFTWVRWGPEWKRD